MQNQQEKHNVQITQILVTAIFLFLCIATSGVYLGVQYINNQLLISSEHTAIDMAQILTHNFHITDKDVQYMKTLDFNQMEVDPINKKLMNMRNNVMLNNHITNVYVIAPLKPEEIKYTTDQDEAEFFGYEVGTPLDGVWLLNGIVNEDNQFVPMKRDDVYRYTKLNASQKKALATETSLGEYSSDAWGQFITGYAPLYSEEGNLIGLLGVDMDPDKFQNSAQNMILSMLLICAIIIVALLVLVVMFYLKYIRIKENQLSFEFYSRMSHDMRTPMNGILGLAALSTDEVNVQTLQKNFAMVAKTGQYMMGLINDTLDIQKLDAGRMVLDPKIRVAQDIFDHILAIVRNSAVKKNITLDVNVQGIRGDIYCWIDEIRITQIFMNILTNAIKFTPENGRITIDIQDLSRHEDLHHVCVKITDTGIGMSQEFIQDKLFQPFAQEQDSTTVQYGGSGLGMSIVKSLVDLMGGRIEVTSVQGQGTTFAVYLTIKEVSPEQVAELRAKKQEKQNASMKLLAGARILLCEDNPLNGEIASKLLEKKGCLVEIATNGQEGLNKFQNATVGYYGAILMDIRMPILDGISATKAIRALARKDAITVPIIAMTANAYPEDIQQCMAAGMNGHIVKPINPELLYTKLAEMLAKTITVH